MTQACCPSCRLRFTPAASAYIVACPECGEPPQSTVDLEGIVGFRLVGPEDLPYELVGPEDLPYELPHALAVSIPPPEPGARS